jgi:hypothetical protein
VCVGVSIISGQKQQSMVLDDDQRQSTGTKECGNGMVSMAAAINGGVKPQYAVAVAGE